MNDEQIPEIYGELDIESRILFEDEHYFALNKKAGELVVADRWGLEENVLLHRAGEHLRSKGHQKDATGRDLYAVHRLDRETSGVVLFAKHQEAHRAISMLFETREVTKLYWAWVAGCPTWSELRVDLPLVKAKGKHGKGRSFVNHAEGKPSQTHFHLKACYGDIAWLSAEPYTGRLHQIRVHAHNVGFPLLNDVLYTKTPWKSKVFPKLPLERVPLHAVELGFTHPITKNDIRIQSELDSELLELQKILSAQR